MDAVKIKLLIESITDTSAIYLLEALSSTSGFFSNDSKLLYIAKDDYNYSYEGIETDYLRLQTHVRISAVQNNPTFNDDFYNIIIYKGSLTDGNINSFIQLCTIHSHHANELNFKEFFYSLISLFQLPVEQAFKNAVGLYGELKFMQYAKERRNIDISNSWHRRGSYSQYDFSNGEKSIEIKTNLSDNSIVTIKHHQIFGEHPCYLVVIDCEQYENGETIEELIGSMYDDPLFFNGMNFTINLAKELKRVSVKDIKEVRFGIRNIQFFDTDKINQFPSISEAISKLTYQLDVSEFTSLSENIIDAIISTF
jgi:hypothetical protein